MTVAALLVILASGCGKPRPTGPRSDQPSAPAPSTIPTVPATPIGADEGPATIGSPAPQAVRSPKPGDATTLAQLATWNERAGVRLPRSQSPSVRRVAMRYAAKATPAVQLGRAGLWLYGRRLLPTQCRGLGGRCGARRGPHERLQLRPDDLGAATAEGPRVVPALAKATRHLKGREVLLLADVDVSAATLTQVFATLRGVGAHPPLAALGTEGVVAVWPDDAPHDRRLLRRSPPGESAPADVEGLTVELTTAGVTVVLQRAGGGYMRRTLRRSPWRGVADWAARVAALPKPVHIGLLAVEADVDVATLVRAVEALIAPCLIAPCTTPARRLSGWQMIALAPGAGAGEVDPGEPPASVHSPAAARPARNPQGPGLLPPDERAGRPRLRQPHLDLDLRAHTPPTTMPHVGDRK